MAILTGSTGTGKSGIIPLLNQEHEVIYGEDNIEEFFMPPSSSGKYKIWFIDETNIADPNRWSIFENLWNNPPRILYRGHLYPIAPGNKIICAINNKSYQGGCHEHSVFSRHGALVEFTPFPKDFLASNVINPLLSSITDENEKRVVRDIFLTAYENMNKRLQESNSHLAVSPRNLEMMVRRWLWLKNIFSTEHSYHLAHMAAYRELKNLVPHKNTRKALKTEFNFDRTFLTHWKAFKTACVNTALIDNYVVTQSRYSPLYKLHEWANLRKELMAKGDPHQRLQGLLFEGEEGSGNTLLCESYLISQKIPFVQLDLTKDMDTQLIDAYRAGIVVIIKYLNMLPLERTINQLMMGVDPQECDPHKNRPPLGFGVIAIQKELTHENTKPLSPASLNSFTVVKPKHYPTEEKAEVLVKRFGWEPTQATQLATCHEHRMRKPDCPLTLHNLFKPPMPA